ncbi:MAG: FAD:protein FMN transferase [Lachnospiraceae bacterium]|nr:FAD:protein FMN transferase [Lachnospiraceae bacterium]
MKKDFYVIALVCGTILAACFFCGCFGKEGELLVLEDSEASLEFFAMDTYMRVVAYGREDQANAAVSAAREEIYRLEKLLSTELETSEIYQVNAHGKGELSTDALSLLQRAVQLSEMTEGAFDFTVYPLMRAWGFMDGQYRVPSPSEILGLLGKTKVSGVLVDEEQGYVEFEADGMQIDLGGIAKGYAAARIMDIYREKGIANGLVSLGGNVQVLGTKPDGNLWRIGLQHPDGGKEYLGVLQAMDLAVVTSGGYERYFEQDGERYHHILDPSTGYPAESGLLSATVVSADGTLADGLSTAIFVMGKERAVAFWREHIAEFDMILYTQEEELYVTQGIVGDFSSSLLFEIISEEP